jgi:hypothetical protein
MLGRTLLRVMAASAAVPAPTVSKNAVTVAQAHGRAHDDAEYPLGADEQPAQVEPRDRLQGATAHRHELAVG